MAALRFAAGLLLLALASTSFAACSGSKSARVGELTDLSQLKGKTVAVTSLLSATTLEARYVLQEKYGLSAGPANSDVTLKESNAESLPQLLHDGAVDAVIAGDFASVTLSGDQDLLPFSHITKEMRVLTGEPTLTSLLLTYPDVAQEEGAALEELNRMLATSVTYFRSNKQGVLRAVAADRDVSRKQLDRWWDGHDTGLGDMSAGVQQELLAVWRAAVALGDIDAYPALSDVLFGLQGEPARPTGRVTISIAVLDDASRRAALYAIDQDIVRSDLIDVSLTYLPASSLVAAAAARQFDVVEAEPLTVPLGAANGQDFTILSGGFVDLDGTLAFTRAVARSG